MLRGIPEARDATIVEASSGSTVLSLGIIARVLWGHTDVNAYVTNKKHPESLNLLRFFGITPWVPTMAFLLASKFSESELRYITGIFMLGSHSRNLPMKLESCVG